MRNLFFGLAFIGCAQAFAQPAYLRIYDLPGDVEVEGADLTADGGLIVAPIVDSANMLMRLDASGNIEWARTYSAIGSNLAGTFDGSVFTMRFMDVAARADGFVVVGTGSGADWGPDQAAQSMVLLDAHGVPEFSRSSYAHLWGSSAVAIQLSADEMLMTGRSGNISGGFANLWRMALDTIAPIADHNTHGAGQDSYIYTAPDGFRATPDGGAVITGSAPSMFIVKYDASFNVVWSGQWNGFDAGIVDGLADGTVFYTDPTRVVRFAPAGTIDWSLELPSGYGAITGMAARSDGSLVLTGPRTDGSAWLAELDASGAVNWTMRLGQPGDELVPADLMLASDGGVRIVGMAGSAPRRLFSLAANASGEAGDCSVVDVVPVFQATTLVLVGTPSHWVGSANADFLARMVSNASNTYGTAATACSGDGLLLQGTLFHDADMNGDYESGETCFPNLFIGMQPDAVYAGMNTDCGYDLFTAQPGTHVLTPVPLDPWWTLSTDSSSYTVAYTGGGSTITGLDFGFVPGMDTTALTGTFVTAQVVCNNFSGNPVQGWLHVLNSGTTQPDVVAAVTLDSLLTLVSSEPPADSIVGQTVYWHLDDIAYYSIADIHMQLQSPGLLDVPDTLYSAGVLLDPGTLDTLGTFNWAGAVVCSFDPNDKQVTPLGSGTIGGIPPETHWLTYTVRFQNTGTFAATDVVIQDQLSPLLDPLTLQFLGASHALTAIDLSGAGLVAFRFDNIQLPDSGADEAGSHGHVSFRVRPRPGLHHLDNIVNDAAIFFDQNAPVITNAVRNTIINCVEAEWPAMIFDFGDGTLWANYDGNGEYTFTYQWLLNGNAIPGATGMDLQPTQNGGYTVRMTDQYGCDKESEVVEVIGTGTLTPNQATIRLFPNPMSDAARVFFAETAPADARIDLVDASGRVLRSIRGDGSREVLIERGHLESGMYLLRVFFEDERTGSVRVVVD